MNASRAWATSIGLLALAAWPGLARADNYPVAGSWTYDNPTEKGAAKTCGQHVMTFNGNLRHDTGTSVPDYKNVSVVQSGAGTWRVVDEFFNAITRGRVPYTLRLLDDDHIELRLDMGGRTYQLRRCA